MTQNGAGCGTLSRFPGGAHAAGPWALCEFLSPACAGVCQCCFFLVACAGADREVKVNWRRSVIINGSRHLSRAGETDEREQDNETSC